MVANQQIVAEQLIANAPLGWAKLIVRSEVYDGASKNEFDYIDDQGKQRWFEPDAKAVAAIGRAIRDLRQEMQQPNRTAWKNCLFVLYPDGRYTLDVEYPDEAK